MTPDVNLHVDQFQLEGVEQWIAWVTWLRAPTRVTGLELVSGELSGEEIDWKLTAQWRGLIDDVPSISPEFSMTFQMAGDRVSAIRTRRADHTFVLGDSILPPVAFAAMLGLLSNPIESTTGPTCRLTR